MRTTTTAPDPADTLAPTARPSVRSSQQEMERAITALLVRQRRREVYGDMVAAAGLHIPPRAGWLLLRLGEHQDMGRGGLARLLHVSDADLRDRVAELAGPGYVRPVPADPGQPLSLTPAGREAYQALFAQREKRLHRLAADWHPERYPDLMALLTRITHHLAASDEKPGADLDTG